MKLSGERAPRGKTYAVEYITSNIQMIPIFSPSFSPTSRRGILKPLTVSPVRLYVNSVKPRFVEFVL
jgi:hypothetical protein